jgi:hypothetical protein
MRIRHSHLLAAAALFASAGNSAVHIAIPWLVLEITGSSANAGVVLGISGFSVIFTAPVIGGLIATGRRTIANTLRWRARLDLFNRTTSALAETAVSNNSSETTILVHDCLSRLRKKDREILLLIEWDEFSIHEAATILEISEAAATKRLKQARDSFIGLYSASSSEAS